MQLENSRPANSGGLKPLFTVGHSILEFEPFAKLLKDFGVELVVDVRSVPQSARLPHFSQPAFEKLLGAEHISTIFTLGFTKKTAEEFFRLLRKAQVQKLIDIRENRVGQLAGFAKYPDLAFFLNRILGIAYDYQPIFAPSPEIRNAYRKTRDWAQFEKSFLKLMMQRGVLEAVDPASFEGRVALLCSEAEPDKCHRRLVAEMLAQHWTSQGHHIEVKHLGSPKPAPRKKRTRTSHEGTVLLSD